MDTQRAASAIGHPIEQTLGVSAGGRLLLGYVVLVAAAATWTFRRRDPA